MKFRNYILIITIIIIYIVFPFFAGIFSIGDRSGPKIYFERYHIILYRLGYDFTHEDRARANLMYDRPIFYGFTGKKTKYYYEYEHLLNEGEK